MDHLYPSALELLHAEFTEREPITHAFVDAAIARGDRTHQTLAIAQAVRALEELARRT